MAYNIVLVEPEFPNNTVNIGRLSLASGSILHLVKPFGFELSDSRLKRAGLDYWKHIKVITYDNLEEFLTVNKNEKMVFLSASAEKDYDEIKYEDNLFFLFGKESTGLPKQLLKENKDKSFKIPIHSSHVRSLNLSNSVSIVIFEGLRLSKLAINDNLIF